VFDVLCPAGHSVNCKVSALHLCKALYLQSLSFTSAKSKLLEKLEKQGLRGLPLKLFENYLANRTHFVSIEDIQSQKASVTCGVPQGSNLGPLFFLLYVNDITHVSKFKTTLFADDTVLSFSAKSVIDLKKKVNEELNNIDNWLKHNKLSLNYNKTYYMLITKIPLDFDMNISINNHIISKVDNLKYLGVVLDNKLTWNSHIAQVKK